MEDIELIVERPDYGYAWVYGGVRSRRGGNLVRRIEVPVPLVNIFERTRPVRRPPVRDPAFVPVKGRGPNHEAPIEHPDFGSCWRAITASARTGRIPRYATTVTTIEQGLFERFAALVQLRERGEECERAILQIATRYGLLQGGTPDDESHHWETAAYWCVKAEEMADATERRAKDSLSEAHYHAIAEYIGPLVPVLSSGERLGGVTLAYRTTSLLGALWLQWAREPMRYQGRCLVCDAPLLGRRGKKTCSDYCRKKLSLELKESQSASPITSRRRLVTKSRKQKEPTR